VVLNGSINHQDEIADLICPNKIHNFKPAKRKFGATFSSFSGVTKVLVEDNICKAEADSMISYLKTFDKIMMESLKGNIIKCIQIFERDFIDHSANFHPLFSNNISFMTSCDIAPFYLLGRF
jgi:hypothetical protein